MNRNYFWFGLAAAFAVLIFWTRKHGCGCAELIAGGAGIPGSIGSGAFGAGSSAGGPGLLGPVSGLIGTPTGPEKAACGCSGVALKITSPYRPSSPTTTVRGPGSYVAGGLVSRPGVRVGTSIFAQTNVDNQLAGYQIV